MIDVELDASILRCQDKKLTFNVFEDMYHHNKDLQCYRVDVVEEGYPKVKNSNILEMKEFPPHLKHVLLRK